MRQPKFVPLPSREVLDAEELKARAANFQAQMARRRTVPDFSLLFRRADYFALGGHETVRNHLVEDVALGRRVAARIADGFRLVNADGTLLVECRMYEVSPGFGTALKKTAAPLLKNR